MIHLSKSMKYAIHLSLDAAGRDQLLKAAQTLLEAHDLSDQVVDIEAHIDLSIPKRKKSRVVLGTLTLQIGLGHIVRVPEHPQLKWSMEADEIDDLIDRLMHRETEGCFVPAEFTQVQAGHRNHTVYLMDWEG